MTSAPGGKAAPSAGNPTEPMRKLANVPASEFADLFSKGPSRPVKSSPMRRLLGLDRAPDLSGLKTHRVHFNAALWIRFYRQPADAIGFWLEYEDASGVQTVLVDQARVQDAGQLMLAGQVTLLAVGHLFGIRACCSGIRADEHFRVEELFVQRQHSRPGKSDRVPGSRAPLADRR